MKVENRPSISSSTAVRRKSAKASSVDFSSLLEEDEAVSGPSGVSNITPYIPLLSLQEVEEDVTEKKRKAMKNATKMIDYMENVRDGILDGTISRSNLQDLQNVTKEQRGRFSDPKVEDILDQIEIRASVELEKLKSK